MLGLGVNPAAQSGKRGFPLAGLLASLGRTRFLHLSDGVVVPSPHSVRRQACAEPKVKADVNHGQPLGPALPPRFGTAAAEVTRQVHSHWAAWKAPQPTGGSSSSCRLLS